MRTLLLRLAMAVALALSVSTILTPDLAEAQTVRKSITQFTPAELMSLRRAVATMKSRDTAPRNSPDFRRSWIFWVNMHSHFGDTCKGAITADGLSSLQLWHATTTDEVQTWCKCQHNNDFFLPWHRMYLWYFERVLRQAANDPTLTLPYWDYQTDPLLPLAFREQTYVDETGATVPNPLYVAARRADVQSGAAGLAASTSSTTSAMAATTYTLFRQRLESTPHGAVHCAIGVNGCPTGLMGSVPGSAMDPIFYLHHNNIDRLYECWLNVSPTTRYPTSTTILNKVFYFPDENGVIVKRKVSEMLRLSQLGYSYASGAGCPAVAPVAASAAMTMAQMSATELNRGTTTVPMGVEADSPAAGSSTMAISGAGGVQAKVGGAVVVIEGFTASKVPGVNYNVYLANAKGQRAQIGVIDFFGFDADPAMDMSGHNHGGGEEGRRFEFDATDAVNRLGLRSSRKPNLIFEPTTGLTNSTPDKAAKAIGADAKVRFRAAWLRVREQ